MNDLSTSITEIKQHSETILKIAEKLLNNKKAEAIQLKLTTLEEVRAVLAEKSRDGHTEKIRELLLKHGAKKLSEIDPANYPALLADAEALGDG